MDIWYVTLLYHVFVHGFVRLQAKCVGSQSDMQLAFRNVSNGECYYRAKKHFREDLLLPELLSDNLSDVPEDIFQ
jgi:hypothetical protein